MSSTTQNNTETVQSAVDHFGKMPIEMIDNIFSFLTPTDLITIENVCERFNIVSSLSASRIKSLELFRDPRVYCEFEQEAVCVEEIRILETVGPFLQSLTVGFSSHENQARMDHQIQRYCNDLRQLTYVGRVSTPDRYSIPVLSKLNSLGFLNSSIDDDHVEFFLKATTTLKQFTLFDTNCDFSCLMQLTQNLEELHLKYNKNDQFDHIINYLKQNNNLRKFSIASFSALNLRHLVPFLSQVKELSFTLTNYSHLSALVELENVVSVNLNLDTDQESMVCLFESLSRYCKWEQLTITTSTNTFEAISRYFLKLKQLRCLTLMLHGSELAEDTKAFVHLSELQQLQSLTVDSHVGINLQQISQHLPPSVQDLSITPRKTCVGVEALSRLSGLRHIMLILEHCVDFQGEQLQALSDIIKHFALKDTLDTMWLAPPPIGPSFGGYAPLFSRLRNHNISWDVSDPIMYTKMYYI